MTDLVIYPAVGLEFSILIAAHPRFNSRRKISNHRHDLIAIRRIYPDKTVRPLWRLDSLRTFEFDRIQLTTLALIKKILLSRVPRAGFGTRCKNYCFVRCHNEHNGSQTGHNP
jgi:hypothetical protein